MSKSPTFAARRADVEARIDAIEKELRGIQARTTELTNARVALQGQWLLLGQLVDAEKAATPVNRAERRRAKKGK